MGLDWDGVGDRAICELWAYEIPLVLSLSDELFVVYIYLHCQLSMLL